MLIDNSLLIFTGGQVGIANKQRNLVSFVEVFPKHIGKSINITFDSNTLGLALEGGDHGITIAHIGVDKMS